MTRLAELSRRLLAVTMELLALSGQRVLALFRIFWVRFLDVNLVWSDSANGMCRPCESLPRALCFCHRVWQPVLAWALPRLHSAGATGRPWTMWIGVIRRSRTMDGSPPSNRDMSGYSGPVESEPPALAGAPQRTLSMTRVILGAAGLFALAALLVAALAISSSFNLDHSSDPLLTAESLLSR